MVTKIKKKDKDKSKGKSRGANLGFRGGISELMRNAHRMQSKLEAVKEDLKQESWVVESAGGKIKVTINGGREIQKVEIDKELIDPAEAESLQDVIVSAMNAAFTFADEKITAATEEVTGGMSLPGIS